MDESVPPSRVGTSLAQFIVPINNGSVDRQRQTERPILSPERVDPASENRRLSRPPTQGSPRPCPLSRNAPPIPLPPDPQVNTAFPEPPGPSGRFSFCAPRGSGESTGRGRVSGRTRPHESPTSSMLPPLASPRYTTAGQPPRRQGVTHGPSDHRLRPGAHGGARPGIPARRRHARRRH